MLFQTMIFSYFILHLKVNKMLFRGVVNSLCCILYSFHSSRCNSPLSKIMQLDRCFESS